MINLPRESTVGGSINSDRVDSPLLASNNLVKNGKTVDEAMDDVLQEEGRKRGNSFTRNCKDVHLPHRPWNDVIKIKTNRIKRNFHDQLSIIKLFIHKNSIPLHDKFLLSLSNRLLENEQLFRIIIIDWNDITREISREEMVNDTRNVSMSGKHRLWKYYRWNDRR